MLDESWNITMLVHSRKISFLNRGTSWKIKFGNLCDLEQLWYILENHFFEIFEILNNLEIPTTPQHTGSHPCARPPVPRVGGPPDA